MSREDASHEAAVESTLSADLFSDEECDYVLESKSPLPGLQLLKSDFSEKVIQEMEESARLMIGDLNQSHRFGPLPLWALRVGNTVLPYLDVEAQLECPVFDQLIVNLYRKGEGIKPHVDLLKFEGYVVGFSFHPGTIVFRSLERQPDAGQECKVDNLHDGKVHFSYELQRGDMYIIEDKDAKEFDECAYVYRRPGLLSYNAGTCRQSDGTSRSFEKWLFGPKNGRVARAATHNVSRCPKCSLWEHACVIKENQRTHWAGHSPWCPRVPVD